VGSAVGVGELVVRSASAVACVRLLDGATGVVPELVEGGAGRLEGPGSGAGGGTGVVSAMGVGELVVRSASAVACVRLPAGATGVVPELVAAISAYVRRLGDKTRGVAEVCPRDVVGDVELGSVGAASAPLA
jgi:hypothetical protein